MFRELQERHLSSTKEAIPVALEYLYGGSNVVQRSDKQEEVQLYILFFIRNCICVLLKCLFIFCNINDRLGQL